MDGLEDTLYHAVAVRIIYLMCIGWTGIYINRRLHMVVSFILTFGVNLRKLHMIRCIEKCMHVYIISVFVAVHCSCVQLKLQVKVISTV